MAVSPLQGSAIEDAASRLSVPWELSLDSTTSGFWLGIGARLGGWFGEARNHGNVDLDELLDDALCRVSLSPLPLP